MIRISVVLLDVLTVCVLSTYDGGIKITIRRITGHDTIRWEWEAIGYSNRTFHGTSITRGGAERSARRAVAKDALNFTTTRVVSTPGVG